MSSRLPEAKLGLPAESLDDKAPVEVEDRDPVGERVELGVKGGRYGAERVEVGDEVAPDPVHVDELLHLGLFDEAAVNSVAGADRVDVVVPARRVVGHGEGREHLVVKAVLAHQQLVHAGEEKGGVRPLDDAVVVGGGEHDHLGQTELGQHLRVASGELGRVAERSHPDDGALAGHEPRAPTGSSRARPGW